VEKELSRDFSISYVQTFMAEPNERLEFSGRYYFREQFRGKTFVELTWRRRYQLQEELAANLGFNFRF